MPTQESLETARGPRLAVPWKPIECRRFGVFESPKRPKPLPATPRSWANSAHSVSKRFLIVTILAFRVIGQESWWQFFASDRDPQDYVDFLNADMEKTKALDLAWSRGKSVCDAEHRVPVRLYAHTDKELDEAVISLDAACRAIV